MGQELQVEAHTKWPLASRKFAKAFRYQYVISEKDIHIPGFRRFDRLDFVVQTGEKLPTCEIFDESGAFLGYMIGIAVSRVGLIDSANNTIPIEATDQDFWDKFETWLVDIAGRYGFILSCKKETRFYCDPVGMIGAVYNKSDGILSSSTLFAIVDPLRPNPKYNFDIVRNNGGKFSLFHTADERVRRLNPNFYLRLSNFSETRHWPKAESFQVEPENYLATYDEISRISRFNIDQISSNFPVSFPVTGGQDSRLLLSFAKDLKHDITYFTHINNYANRRDAAIGSELCKKIQTPHHTYDKHESEIKKWEIREFQEAWNTSFGTEFPLPQEYTNGTILKIPEAHVIMRAHQTDILRAVYVFKSKEYWSKPAWQIKKLLIVPFNMFNNNVVENFKQDFVNWQESLPEPAKNKAADFMFLEIYSSSTMGASFPALWRNFYISPYNSRRLISLSLSFPEEERRASKPVFDIIERNCPELSEIPFDFELGAELSNVGDVAHYDAVAGDRIQNTKSRLNRLAALNFDG